MMDKRCDAVVGGRAGVVGGRAGVEGERRGCPVGEAIEKSKVAEGHENLNTTIYI